MTRPAVILLLLLACALPAAGSTYMSPMMDDTDSGSGMMRTVEERAINATDHEEMEELMEKMMEGNLTPAEQDRLVELMNRYPAGYSTMLGRMAGYGTGSCGMDGESWQDMPYYGLMLIVMPVAIILGGLFLLVWLAVGLLAILWLLGRVSNR